MPPKQKEQKKGVNYRPSVIPKDIIPATVKEPPREVRPTKPIQNFPEIVKKSEFELKEKFEAWPGNEAAKTFDFGIESTVHFKDPQQNLVKQYLSSSKRIIEWKTFDQAEHLQQLHKEDTVLEEQHAQHTKSLHEIKYLDDQPEENVTHSNIVMIESFMRDETPEEAERRKKEQVQRVEKAAKDKKKPAKKPEQIKQQGPIKVKDVELSDVIVTEWMLQESKWIGSQLQLIKQRSICDIYTQQPIWKKIYPQINELPVLCKSGRYWVKLYYMGKQIKVEVDDEVPLNSQLQYLFPRSSKQSERWTFILTKALVKLISINNANCNINGNGLVLYALTGLISEKICMNGFSDWEKLSEQLSDKHYLTKDVYVTCYSTPNFKAHPPSNLVQACSQLYKMLEFGNSQFQLIKHQNKNRSKSSEQLMLLPEDEKPIINEQIKSNLMNGYAYYVGDHLFNGTFNMVYSQKMSDKQLRLRQQYNELTKISLGNKAREEKLEYRKKKKDKRDRIYQQEHRRENLLKKPPQPYHFVKVCADINIKGDYSVDDIAIAKKCIMNDLQYPPNYDIPTSESKNDDGKSTQSYSMISKVKEEKEELVIRPLEDFSQLPNIQDPLKRPEKGVWIKDQDFLSSFEYIQIFYDPNKLAQKQVLRVDYSANSEFTIDENKEVLILEKQQGKDQDTVLIFGFSPEYPIKRSIIQPYTLLQKFNFDQFKTIQSLPTLQDNINCLRMKLSNQNHVFKVLTVSKGGYCYWISSNAKFRLASVISYLTDFQGYTPKSVQCDYPAVEADRYNMYFRLKFDCQESTTAIIRLKNIDPYVLRNLRYRLLKVPTDNSYMSYEHEGIHQNKYEKTMIVSSYLRLLLQGGNRYYLLLEGILPFNILDGSIEIEVLLKTAGATFELVEQVEPCRYIEKYNPNKYGLICREKLFTNSDCVATIYFQLINGEVVNGGIPVSTDKKAGKKGGKEQLLSDVMESEVKEKRPVKLQLFCNDKIIVSDIGYNEALLSNVTLKSTKGGDANNYYVQATFDLREWPQAVVVDEITNKIFWSMKLFSSDSVAVVRDTDKEDQQKEIKRQWQEKEPGRGEKAKKSRKKYLLQLRQEAGEQLTEEELKIVNALRPTKKQQLEEEKKLNEDKKGGKAGKKEDKKSGKDSKKEEVIAKPVEHKPREWPKSNSNIMIEIQDFLRHFEAERVMIEKATSEAWVRSSDDLRSIEEGAHMANEERVGIIQRNIEDREMTKIHQKQQKQLLNLFINQRLEEFKKGWQEYTKARNDLFQKSKTKVQKEKVLVDIARSQKPTVSEVDLTKFINEYQTMQQYNKDIVDVLHMVRKNIRIAALNDRLASALASFDIDEINKIDDEINKDQVEGTTPELLQQMMELMEEAKKNPNYILEKQTEAKKGKKGKK